MPYPVLRDSKDGYKPFQEVFGQETSEKDRPSSGGLSKPTEEDKKLKSLLVGGIIQSLNFSGLTILTTSVK